MKIIRINNIRIIYKNINEYTIQTPTGVFKNLTDAIKVYPQIKEHKNIAECNYCGKPYIKIGRKNGGRKYCSDECSQAYRRISKRETNRMWARDKWLRDSKKQLLFDDTESWNNPEYHQNDTFWGIGSSHLHGKPKNDFQHEHNIIKKELKRYKLHSSADL